MSVPRSLCTLVVLGAVLVPMAHAQVATSTNYQLADFSLDAGGGGIASIGNGTWVSVGITSGGTLSSSNYQAGVGILETTDPVPQNAPILFGLTPDYGNKAGGSLITVSGYNFDKFGVGPSVTMTIDGVPATGLSVLSNTQLTATVPAGVSGIQNVVVTSSLGSGSDPDAWLYTPAVISTEATQVGGEMDIRNYGTPGNALIMLAAGGTGSAGRSSAPSCSARTSSSCSTASRTRGRTASTPSTRTCRTCRSSAASPCTSSRSRPPRSRRCWASSPTARR
jgi:hypothetical protein